MIQFSKQFSWFQEPPLWSLDDRSGCLTVEPAASSDFWQRTHYGFQADNGHFFHTAVAQDFRMSVRVVIEPKAQYDQAGLMVRLSPDCWLKTSVEFEPEGMSRLGAVVTNSGYSDWSTQDVSRDLSQYWLRVDRESFNYIVQASLDGERWTQLRVARLMEDSGSTPVECGVYACSPKGKGLVATFHDFSLELRNSTQK